MHSGQASEGHYYSFIHAAQVSATERPGDLILQPSDSQCLQYWEEYGNVNSQLEPGKE